MPMKTHKADKVPKGGALSKLIVDSIILESANVLADDLPNIYTNIQKDTRLEKKKIKLNPEPSSDAGSNPSDTSRSSVSDNYEPDPFIRAQSASELEEFKHQLITDDRAKRIFQLRENFSEEFNNQAYLHPHGTTDFNYQAIPQERKKGLERFKNKVRKDNYKYLLDHPELRALIYLFTKNLITVRPPDPIQFMAEFFTKGLETENIQGIIEDEKKRVSDYRCQRMLAQERIRMCKTCPREPPPVPPPPPPPPPSPPKKKCKICPARCICKKGGKVVKYRPDPCVPRENTPQSGTSDQKGVFDDIVTVFFKTEDGLTDEQGVQER